MFKPINRLPEPVKVQRPPQKEMQMKALAGNPFSRKSESPLCDSREGYSQLEEESQEMEDEEGGHEELKKTSAMLLK